MDKSFHAQWTHFSWWPDVAELDASSRLEMEISLAERWPDEYWSLTTPDKSTAIWETSTSQEILLLTNRWSELRRQNSLAHPEKPMTASESIDAAWCLSRTNRLNDALTVLATSVDEHRKLLETVPTDPAEQSDTHRELLPNLVRLQACQCVLLSSQPRGEELDAALTALRQSLNCSTGSWDELQTQWRSFEESSSTNSVLSERFKRLIDDLLTADRNSDRR